MKKAILGLFSLLFFSLGSWAQSGGNSETPQDFKIRAVAELGFLSVIDHKVQFSNSGTYFDYRDQGGQDVLFPVSRYSLELEFNKKNTFYLLYQPLRLESQVLLQEDLIVDDMVFPANTGVNLLYSFPFYRLSYTRELLSDNDKWAFAIGASLQIRNATISFESTDGSRFRTNRDVGLVPALKIKSRAYLSDRVFAELEADGIYAPVSYINGSDNEVVGAILDASLRMGVELNAPVTAFLNARYLGGGAVGTSDVDGPGDGYVRNWLNFFTLTAGFIYEFAP
ncbi:hypothetical protein Oweho_2514 [Owenweeksia hongkongensis DSM 17368]|uniref:Outer membrane protein beta-barrel domain-containing protein n=1 Tax=Owenweeksia hongkongensis (strain DSM 17368 / CIP 108786 / JCM 12287 / NRRL B-23963 / UST20020801) TaxID=926562 RepID=G8R7V3_OWEHD|nr:hypothetical protein [Owenweeksia hongkongensis]AEV33484.1 hypothetical protein Oweho_2514 [Owenweeksia hongkongensis DSM 17368]